MRKFVDRWKNNSSRKFGVNVGFSKTWLVCLLVPLALLGVGLVTAQEGGIRDEVPDATRPVPVLGVISDVEITGLKSEPAKVSHKLVAAEEEPAENEKLIAELPYPPTGSPEQLTSEQIETIAKLPPKVNEAGMVVHPAMIPLFRDMILYYTGGKYQNAPLHFRLHTPEPYEEGKKYPLVVWMHGSGECGTDNLNQLGHLHHILPYLVGPKKRDFFLLVPQCPRTHRSWEAPSICSTTVRLNGSVECHINDDPIARGNAPISFTLAMVDAVTKDYPVDPNRITVSGLSTGGEGVWKILERRPELFAAAVPIVSWEAMSEKSLRENPILKKIPIWAIYSSDDNGIDHARKEFERMQEAGCTVSKTEFGVCGHRAWTPAMLQGDVFGWLISRAKEGDRYYAAEESATGPEKIGVFAEVTEGDLAKKQPTLAPAKPEEEKEVKEAPAAPIVEPRSDAANKTVKLEELAGAAGRKAKFEIVEGRKMVILGQPITRPVESNLSSRQIDVARMKLIMLYYTMGETQKMMAVADKVKHREGLVDVLLQLCRDKPQMELLDYIDRELDRMEQRVGTPAEVAVPVLQGSRVFVPRGMTPAPVLGPQEAPAVEKLEPIPAEKKSPMDECGKEWAMTTSTQYGLFPNGWDQEIKNVPDFVINDSGKELYLRLIRAFNENDLETMREICDSFIKLDDIPLSSPWFDTSGGRLKGRIQYTLNDKAEPVVEFLREAAKVKGDKKEFAELAQKALERIEKITNPAAEEETP